MKSNKLNRHDSLKFIFGGNSTFTFKNKITENRFTFRVRKHNTNDIYFVSVLTQPDTYTFIGSIFKEGNYRHSVKSKISSSAQSVKVFDYVLRKLHTDSLSESIEVWHEGRCGRCNRKLTVPESIESGFGPECIRRQK